jgi:hypothetical protein
MRHTHLSPRTFTKWLWLERTGTHRIAIDPGCSDLLATAALDGFIDPQHEWTAWGKRRH